MTPKQRKQQGPGTATRAQAPSYKPVAGEPGNTGNVARAQARGVKNTNDPTKKLPGPTTYERQLNDWKKPKPG
jgi:hypothetical protein